MLVITSPAQPTEFDRPAIFLGGAITDWREEAINLLSETGQFATCFNPRNDAVFLPDTQSDQAALYKAQIKWEHYYLLTCDVVLFWLPQATLSATTRFEIGLWYGKLLGQGPAAVPELALGIEPGATGERYFQTVLAEVGVPVHSTLEATCAWAVVLAEKART